MPNCFSPDGIFPYPGFQPCGKSLLSTEVLIRISRDIPHPSWYRQGKQVVDTIPYLYPENLQQISITKFYRIFLSFHHTMGKARTTFLV